MYYSSGIRGQTVPLNLYYTDVCENLPVLANIQLGSERGASPLHHDINLLSQSTTSQHSFPAIWRETIHRQKNFPPPKTQPFITSINDDFVRPDDGDVDLIRRISAETRAKISWGLVTPCWCWGSFWLSFPCDVVNIWRPTRPHCQLPNLPLWRPILLVFAQ